MCRAKADGGRRCKCATGAQRARTAERKVIYKRAARYGLSNDEARSLEPDFVYGTAEQRALVAAQSANPATLTAALNDSAAVQFAVLSNPHAPEDVLTSAATEGTPRLQTVVAANPATPEDALRHLVEHGRKPERLAAIRTLASKGLTDSRELHTHNDPAVRALAAEKLAPGHPEAEAIRHTLLQDRNPNVRLAMLRRGGTLPSRFATDPDRRVRGEVARTTRQPELLERLATDRDPEVASAARATLGRLKAEEARKKARPRLDPAGVKAVLNDRDASPDDIRAAYESATKAEDRVRLAVRADAPDAVTALEYKGLPAPARALIAQTHRFEGEEFAASMIRDDSVEVWRALVENPHTPESVVDRAYARLSDREKKKKGGRVSGV